MTDSNSALVQSIKPWLICLGTVMFYFFVFFQLPIFNTIGKYVQSEYGLTPTGLGFLSSSYFLVEALMLIPIAILLDQVSARKFALIVMSLCILFTFCFALIHSYAIAFIYRAINGIGNGLAFLVSMRFASRWLPKRWLGLGMSLIMALIVTGGILAQAPFEILITHVGWRHAVLISAVIGLLFLIYMYFFVIDHPSDKAMMTDALFDHIKLAAKNKQNWYCAFFFAITNLPVPILGDLWGIRYLSYTHGFSTMQSADIASLLFIGLAIGCFMIGWLSDILKKRRALMLVGCALMFFLILIIMYLPYNSITIFSILFFLLGMVVSVSILSFPTATELNPMSLTTASLCIVAIIINIVNFSVQPFYGWLIQHYAAKGSVYTAATFNTAMLILPIAFFIGFLITLRIKETKSRRVVN